MKKSEVVVPERMFSVAEAQRIGISRAQLKALADSGRIERVARGVYGTPAACFSPLFEAEILTLRGTEFVVALESALRFHNLTEAMPHELWIAMRTAARRPAVEFPIRVVRVGRRSFEDGIENHRLGGTTIRVYSVAKTIADMFKFRSSVGTELAVSALKQGLRDNRFSVDELMRHARIDRVANVILPYVEGALA